MESDSDQNLNQPLSKALSIIRMTAITSAKKAVLCPNGVPKPPTNPPEESLKTVTTSS